MEFSLLELAGATLEEAIRYFETYGFIVLTDLYEDVTLGFLPVLAQRMRVHPDGMEALLDPDSPPVVLSEDVRERLARIETPPDLARGLLRALEPLLLRVLGPCVHVSSTYHGQFKGGDTPPVDHGGYREASKFLEVQGQYLLHQDFTGAAIPTSPSAVTLWVGLNTCPDWTLRVYPGSHRLGLLCHEWLQLDDERVEPLGAPVDLAATKGSAVLFNSLLLHSSSNPGPRRRISCDIRFFPLTGFLPSIPHALGDRPLDRLTEAMERADGPTLRAPVLETLAWLGVTLPEETVEPHSILNWAQYVSALLNDRKDSRHWMERFVNEDLGVDPAYVYVEKFHGRTPHTATLHAMRNQLAAKQPRHPLVESLDGLLGRLTSAQGAVGGQSA